MGKGADTYRHKGLRAKLVDELRKKGISDERVLDAMLQVPRHLFFDKTFEPWAYKDNAFPIDCEQTISQPYIVGFMTEAAHIKPTDKILEIGTGSGYQAAVLAELEAVDRAVRRLALEEFGDRAPYLKSFVIKHDGDSVGWLTTAARELRRAVTHWPQRLIERYPDLIRRKLAEERRIYFTRYNPDSINFHTLDLKLETILGFVVHQFTHWIEAERGKRRLAVIATGYFPPNPPLKPDALKRALAIIAEMRCMNFQFFIYFNQKCAARFAVFVNARNFQTARIKRPIIDFVMFVRMPERDVIRDRFEFF